MKSPVEIHFKPLIIYHGGCRDGFCAAWVAKRYYAGRGVECDFFPAVYGQPAPNCSGRCVYLLDFSYPLDVMKKIASEASEVYILDHHKTAEAILSGDTIGGAVRLVHFDMNQSGARLAYNYFFGTFPEPLASNWLVDYVEDRDLWRFALPESKKINAFISTIPLDFKEWDSASHLTLLEAVQRGKAVEAKVKNYVEEVKKNAFRTIFEGYNVPVVNAPQVDISELVGELAAGEGIDGKSESFAMGWFQRSDGMFQYSLRSRGDFDVSELAKRYGGGGHKNAAGFQTAEMVHRMVVSPPEPGAAKDA
jgi:uncharacterized protein